MKKQLFWFIVSLSIACLSYAKVEYRNINIAYGEVLELVIPSNMSTSYAWRVYDYSAEDVTNMTSDYVSSNVEIGGGGYQHWRVTFSAQVSTTSIHFVYMPSYIDLPTNMTDYDQLIYAINIQPSSVAPQR